LKVDSIGELTTCDGNEFQTLTTRFALGVDPVAQQKPMDDPD